MGQHLVIYYIFVVIYNEDIMIDLDHIMNVEMCSYGDKICELGGIH